MADDKPTGQANPDPGAGKTETTPPAAAAPAAGTPPAAAAGTGATGGEPGHKDGAPPASKVPEKYALAIPEGAGPFLDQADLDEWAKVAREKGWSNEEAQASLAAQAAIVIAKTGELREQTLKDADYGGDKFEANQQHARRVIERFRPKDHPRFAGFNRLLEKTGLGNHVELFAFLADIGKAMAEDTPPSGSTGSGAGAKDAVSVLYGKQDEQA